MMAKTDVITLDGALAALNVARFALNPAHFTVYLWADDGMWVGTHEETELDETTDELDAIIETTRDAARWVNTWLETNPDMTVAEDHKGRLVAVRAA